LTSKPSFSIWLIVVRLKVYIVFWHTVCSNTFCTIKRAIKAKKKAITGAAIQAKDTLPNILYRIFLPPFTKPIPTTAPTITWVEDTGTRGMGGKPILNNRFCKPREAKIKSTIASAVTAISAVTGERWKISFPTVRITLWE